MPTPNFLPRASFTLILRLFRTITNLTGPGTSALASSGVEAGPPPTTSDETAAYAECTHLRHLQRPLFSARDYVTGESFVVANCHGCKLTVTTPAPSPADLQKYYPRAYYGSGRRFAGVIEWLLNQLYSFRVYQIMSRQAPGKVLDIGCGRGLLLDKLRSKGWEPQGTELSEEAASYARDKLGLPVSTKPLDELQFQDGEFDLVILWHVLEHVYSPRALLSEVGRILKPGGSLLVAVPNFGSWEARWTRKGWFHLDVPRHLTHFTPETLSAVLDEAGMTIDSVNFFSTEYDFFSFIQSVQNRLGLRHNLLYNLLRTRSAKLLDEHGVVTSAGPVQAALALLTAVPLAAISIVYTPLIAARKRGATIAAYAVKR